MKLFLGLITIWSQIALATTETISFQPHDLHLQREAQNGFSALQVQGVESNKIVGEPELPVKSFLVVGTPADLQVNVSVQSQFQVNNVKPMPVQQQPCRCATDAQRSFQYNEATYRNSFQPYKVSYIGSYRGTPISRVDVALAHYDHTRNSVNFFNEVQVNHNSVKYSFARDGQDLKNYLIVTPKNLESGLTDFIAFKKSQGYNIVVESLLTPQIATEAIQSIIKDHYKKDGTNFVLMIGDETTLPMFKVKTSGSYSTPSDIKYFTQDGADDHIPDMFHGRIAANTADAVQKILAKTMEFEQKSFKNNKGLTQVIGIASNEGSSPSDNDYITSIEKKFSDVLKYTSTHFYQNDKNSNPTNLNKAFNDGAAWLFYVGHGSGYSWPSMYNQYSVSDIPKMANREVVKPVIIDVACQNGRLISGNLGTTFLSTLQDNAFGAAAYYGGTVNISWHPPALMARGIAFEHADKNFKHLGEALFAGQLYLAANWNNQEDVHDNFKWYHLQGDPSLSLAH